MVIQSEAAQRNDGPWRCQSLAAASGVVSVDRLAVVIVDVAVVRRRGVGARSNSALSRMIGDDDGCDADVVLVARFGQLVAYARMQRICVATRFAGTGHETWIHCDADGVCPGRHRNLTVAAVEHEVLTAE